jgi:outer membrane protein assembly factor BamB
VEAVPVAWNIDTGESILWQTPVPGLGHASPIIWGDRIFLATAVKPGEKAQIKVGLYGSGDSYSEKVPHQWRLLCWDKGTGKVLWNKLGHEAVPRLERHTKGTQCNSTPATDGGRIVAIFGSEGLFCFDMSGDLLWHKDLGKMDAGPYDAPSLQWGFASSPVLHEGTVIVQCDVLSEQFLAAFDARDGHERWRTARQDVATWSTPLVAPVPGRTEVIVNGWKQIAGYDLADGRQIWRLKGGGDIPVASPVLAGDFAILTSGHGNYRPIRAVRLDAAGDITPPEIGATNQAVAWCHPKRGNYLQTPIVVGDLVWGCSNDGVVTCFDRRTGEVRYSERIGGAGQAFTASPVAAQGRLYFTSELGEVFVLPATDKFSVARTSSLGGLCLATPAISSGTIFFRTTERLVAVALRNRLN